MAMHHCFDGLLPARRGNRVSGVSGVAPTQKASTGNELVPASHCNTVFDAGVPRVSEKSLELLGETPATPETPWREIYEERAGVMEFEAGFPRDKAEVMAYWDTFAQFAHRQYPTLVAEFESMLHQPLN